MLHLHLYALALAASSNNSDLILSASSHTSPPKLLVLIPGANVATSFYYDTARAIQNGTRAALWVVVPSMPQELCISICPSSGVCSLLQTRVQAVISQAAAQGYKGATSAPDVFIAGHSLGGVCAASLVAGYAKTSQNYSALVLMGSYVDSYDVGGYPAPVLTLGAELDGGLARPGITSRSLQSSDAAAANVPGPEGGTGGSWQLAQKPVVILPGLDHSSFCPGFQVPGDVFPSDVGEAAAVSLIGGHVGAFLHLHTAQPAAVVHDALDTLRHTLGFTRDLLAPLLAAIALEGPTVTTPAMQLPRAPFCEAAQRALLAPLGAPTIEPLRAWFADGRSNFEHSRVQYERRGDEMRGSVRGSLTSLALNASGYSLAFGKADLRENCIVAAHEIGCKFASAERVAEQLQLPVPPTQLTCAELNRQSAATAVALLEQTVAGNATLARYRRRGRPLCFLPDKQTFLDIGPLFVQSTLAVHDNRTCLGVASVALGPVGLDSKLFPGVQYCKLLPPARVVDYIMIDAIKPVSGCLNT